MKKQNIENLRKVVLNTLEEMTDEQFAVFIDNINIDFRTWYKVYIDDKLMPWWACECELQSLKEENRNIKLEQVPYCESWIVD